MIDIAMPHVPRAALIAKGVAPFRWLRRQDTEPRNIHSAETSVQSGFRPQRQRNSPPPLHTFAPADKRTALPRYTGQLDRILLYPKDVESLL